MHSSLQLAVGLLVIHSVALLAGADEARRAWWAPFFLA